MWILDGSGASYTVTNVLPRRGRQKCNGKGDVCRGILEGVSLITNLTSSFRHEIKYAMESVENQEVDLQVWKEGRKCR